jgi:DNA-binding XRE family transcriptional regulator
VRAYRLLAWGHDVMDRLLKTYLRTFRRRWGLTQTELAFLIGVKSNTLVSRFEELKRTPNLSVAFACEIIFDASQLELFPGLFDDVQDAVYLRANELYEELQGSSAKATRAKLDFLEGVLSRSVRRPDKHV